MGIKKTYKDWSKLTEAATAATSSHIELSNSFNDKFIAIQDSTDIAFDRITILENRIDVIEEDLNKKTRQKKIKITIRG